MKKKTLLGATGLLLLMGWQVLLLTAGGAQLGSRSLKLSSSVAGASSSYLLSYSASSAGTLGSVSIQFCANTPFASDPCTTPTGFSAAAAVLSSQTGQTGFIINTALSNSNTIILSRAPSPGGVGPSSYTFDAMINPSVAGSYYVRLQTFATTNITGSYSDYGGIALAINAVLSISAEVPPYLIFCSGVSISGLNCSNVSGDYVDFGELSGSRPSQGLSQFMAATNAKNGYTVTLSGGTLTSGNNIVTALTTGDVSRPGSAQFGLNLRANASPAGGNDPSGPGISNPTALYGQPNFFRFVPGEVVASNPAPDNARLYTVSYVVNVPRLQAPGIYASTITYICLGSF